MSPFQLYFLFLFFPAYLVSFSLNWNTLLFFSPETIHHLPLAHHLILKPSHIMLTGLKLKMVIVLFILLHGFPGKTCFYAFNSSMSNFPGLSLGEDLTSEAFDSWVPFFIPSKISLNFWFTQISLKSSFSYWRWIDLISYWLSVFLYYVAIFLIFLHNLPHRHCYIWTSGYSNYCAKDNHNLGSWDLDYFDTLWLFCGN